MIHNSIIISITERTRFNSTSAFLDAADSLRRWPSSQIWNHSKPCSPSVTVKLNLAGRTKVWVSIFLGGAAVFNRSSRNLLAVSFWEEIGLKKPFLFLGWWINTKRKLVAKTDHFNLQSCARSLHENGVFKNWSSLVFPTSCSSFTEDSQKSPRNSLILVIFLVTLTFFGTSPRIASFPTLRFPTDPSLHFASAELCPWGTRSLQCCSLAPTLWKTNGSLTGFCKWGWIPTKLKHVVSFNALLRLQKRYFRELQQQQKTCKQIFQHHLIWS